MNYNAREFRNPRNVRKIALMVMIGSLMVTDLSVASVSVFGAGAAWFGLFFYANR